MRIECSVVEPFEGGSHNVHIEMPLHPASTVLSIDTVPCLIPLWKIRGVIANEACHTIKHALGDGATSKRDGRSPARICFYHHNSEGLIPLDRNDQAPSFWAAASSSLQCRPARRRDNFLLTLGSQWRRAGDDE